MVGLATTYHAQGRYDEAEVVSIRALNLQQEVLGEKHPETTRSMEVLAATYQMQGHCTKARDIYVGVLGLRQEVLGEKHPETLEAMRDLMEFENSHGS